MKAASPKRGFTFIEMLVWIFIFTSAMVALSNSVLYFYRTNRYAIEQANAVASAQKSIDILIRNIRETSYASNGAYPIVSIANNQFIFYGAVDSDAQVDKVRYFLQGTSLMRGVIDPTGNPSVYTGSEIVSDVADFIRNVDQGVSLFTYYDKNGTQINDLTKVGDVRFVTAAVVADVNPNDQPFRITVHSSAALRNLVGR
jgi:type II secretory pathway pseudopilin PulG